MKAWRDECGVFGIWNDPEASRLTYFGLYALQHRGQESAGIVSCDVQDGKKTHIHHKGLGLASEVFTEAALDRLKGDMAVGHVRYSTTGENLLTNAQPLTAQLKWGSLAIAHNGNIVNANELKKDLTESGAIFQGTNDTECVLHLLARDNERDFIEGVKKSAEKLDGAFSMVIMNGDVLVGVRDPYGFRPLVLGSKINSRGTKALVLASETCALDLIGAQFVREIEPGEIFWVDSSGEHSISFGKRVSRRAHCIFEHVYFARPDSQVFGRSVYESRKNMGRILAKESPATADLVIPVPDSGVPAALGFSEQSQIPFDLGIIRNHYVGRTFIQPVQSVRSFGVKIKLNPQSAILRDKRVVVIDDSIVRGTTCKKIIDLVRAAGAREVHLRIAAPPTVSPCFYGVDTPKKSELIASTKSVEEIRKFIGADTLSYLSMRGLFESVRGTSESFCAACFDGRYPTDLYGHSVV